MIAVDVFADLYGWDDRDRARGHRVADASKALYKMARGGATAAGPVIFVEAALAVLDAIGAYARYRQAQEVTLQLEVECNTLRQMLAELHKQLRIELLVADQQSESRLKALHRRLQQQELTIEISEAQFIALCRQVKALGQVVAKQRLNAPPNCVTLLQLEKTYYHLVDSQLQAAMNFVKE
ncbi:hypothetical protein AVHY2522_14225 [Acidovorax sp. SUPP2522]|uniref:hypothetical protein n=1 Tax=unclassified Acidovorax TaxID=2684926 RepID=UPI0023498BB3|nr:MULTISPECIES: hypothetical protein [unclassified Acidovorax]WCM99527.1 hypothetical protein M5C96_09015 [Acidovorax sp. GBBC 1281]GKT17147.1 hypothetical protein AVHY2522_14225 [Acidovorax sp. SUPP2522]